MIILLLFNHYHFLGSYIGNSKYKVEKTKGLEVCLSLSLNSVELK